MKMSKIRVIIFCRMDLMTEKEKMLKQLLYDANNDRNLIEERAKAKDLCHEYNQLRPSDEGGRRELMKRLLGRTKGDF